MMANIEKDMVNIQRFGYTPMGTFGTLVYKNFLCYTIERPWANNAAFTSCIPPGIYPIELGRFFKKGYPTYELKRVPNRSSTKIHVANTMNDVQGCIGLGSVLGVVDKKWAVLNSADTFAKFMEAMGGLKEGYINIKNLDMGTWSSPEEV